MRKTNTLIKGVSKGEVMPGQEVKWENELRNIPPIQPTKLGGGCKNIDVKYMLTVSSGHPGVCVRISRRWGVRVKNIDVKYMLPVSSGHPGVCVRIPRRWGVRVKNIDVNHLLKPDHSATLCFGFEISWESLSTSV